MSTIVDRVTITDEARTLLERLKAEHGSLIFHQSGGCCDGTAPMCFVEGEFKLGEQDVRLGDIAGCPFYMSASQHENWKHTQITVDLVEGRGSSFSLEAPEGVRFLIRSRVFTEEEQRQLAGTD